MQKLLFIILLILLGTPRVFAQELLLTPPNPSGSSVQKASDGAPFSPGWNYFTVGFDGCTTLNVLNELAANGGSALSVNGIFVKNLFDWEAYTFQSPKQKKLGSGDLLAFNSNQKFFLQINQKNCKSPDSERQAQIEKVKETQVAKENFLDQVSQLPVDLWTKLTNILKNDGPAPSTQTSTSQGLDNLTIGGKTTVNDLGITGIVTNGLLSLDGLNSTINSLSDIKLKVPGGQVTIDTNGNLKVKKLFVDENDSSSKSVGTVVIPAGQAQVSVQTSALTSGSHVFATPDQPVAVGVKTSGTTLTINIDKPLSTELKINWWIIN